jgi:hypothetical protein
MNITESDYNRASAIFEALPGDKPKLTASSNEINQWREEVCYVRRK